MEFKSDYTKVLTSLCYLLRLNNHLTYVPPILGVRFGKLMPELFSKKPTFYDVFKPQLLVREKCYCDTDHFINLRLPLCSCETEDYDGGKCVKTNIVGLCEKHRIYHYNNIGREPFNFETLVRRLGDRNYSEATYIFRHTWYLPRDLEMYAEYDRSMYNPTFYRYALRMASEGNRHAPEFYRYVHMREPDSHPMEKMEMIMSITAFIAICDLIKCGVKIDGATTSLFRDSIAHFSSICEFSDKRMKEVCHDICQDMYDNPVMISYAIILAPKEASSLIRVIRKIIKDSNEESILQRYIRCDMYTTRIEDYWVYVKSRWYDMPDIRDRVIRKIDRIILGRTKPGESYSCLQDDSYCERAIKGAPDWFPEERKEETCCSCS